MGYWCEPCGRRKAIYHCQWSTQLMVDFSPNALVCDIESDSFTDSSSSTLSDSNCPANFFVLFCFVFLMALSKTWDTHLLAATDGGLRNMRLILLLFCFVLFGSSKLQLRDLWSDCYNGSKKHIIVSIVCSFALLLIPSQHFFVSTFYKTCANYIMLFVSEVCAALILRWVWITKTSLLL